MGIMLATCASLLFGIFLGPKYPDVFFWSFMVVFAAVVALYVATTVKDVLLLVGGMIALGIWATIVESFILHSLSEGVRFILSCILLAPVYCPLAVHFVRMTAKRQHLNKEE